MTTSPVVSVTDELVAKLERVSDGAANQVFRSHGWEDTIDDIADELLSLDEAYLRAANPATILALLAERAELRRVIADVKWRVADTTDQLQATGFDGDRRYGLDEWSGPIKNLNMAIGILEKSLEPNK